MTYIDEEFLAHHGILGMKWGIRRWQNKDGSLTSAGRRHYGVGEKMSTNDKTDSELTRRVKHDYNTLSDRDFMMKYKGSKNEYRKRVNKYGDPYMNSPFARYAKKKMAKEKERRAKESLKRSVNKDEKKTMTDDLILFRKLDILDELSAKPEHLNDEEGLQREFERRIKNDEELKRLQKGKW